MAGSLEEYLRLAVIGARESTVTLPADHRIGVYVPEGSTRRVPDRFEGPGTLILSIHDASTSRRLVGTVTAPRLVNSDGEAVGLEAEFDIRFSCGVLR